MQELKNYFITIDREYKEGDVAVFRQKFSGKGVVSAVLFSTALGVYEAQINGKKVGEQMFAPGYTYYPRNLHYQVYDVTALLAEDNLLRVYLGQGWYCGRFTCDNKTQIYGERPAVSWVLEVEEADGAVRRFCSDDANVQSVRSPYEYAGFYDGEIYHADGGPDEVIQPVPYTGALPEVLEESVTGVKIQEEMHVQAVARAGDAVILDFGQNFAGIIEIDPAKMPGGTLKLRHGEILNPDGSLYTTNLRKAKAEIVYHKGASPQKYRPRFTYMGFRYVELTGADYVPGLVTACAVYNEMERTGTFSCENPLADRLYQNQVWGQKSNYVEVPTDCPQRDERQGWTGDIALFASTACLNFHLLGGQLHPGALRPIPGHGGYEHTPAAVPGDEKVSGGRGAVGGPHPAQVPHPLRVPAHVPVRRLVRALRQCAGLAEKGPLGGNGVLRQLLPPHGRDRRGAGPGEGQQTLCRPGGQGSGGVPQGVPG